ncbi:MAG: NAD(P)-dependent alcohol dehydrogenase [Pseudomonadota bacterium]|mgnify:CR=1 FL=1|jgi:NADPH:quinone reductase and related Zn-dependent oxidoreductases|nr:MAG: NAD(P)-dependent alcohol dehydrogenase [Pseudomonadota bacterium]
MKAYILQKDSQSLDNLCLIERPDPVPGPGQLLVRMRAASINYRDQAIVTGGYFGGRVKRDTIPLSDGAGEVVAVGPGVSRFKVGDRVAGTFFLGWVDGPPVGRRTARGAPADGVLAELVVLDEIDAVALPPHLSFEEGACLPCAGLTAWHAVVEACRVRPGDTVLIQGTGGVSLFALQFARASGARVIGISSSDEKLERARRLGLETGINYRRTPEWGDEVQKLTGGRGVDHVIEVGGAGTLARSMQALAFGGRIALIGVLSGHQGDTNPHPLVMKGGSMHGVVVGNRAMFERMNRAIEINGIRPVIDRVFPFAEARAAYEYQQSGALFGKVVIAI